MQLRLFVLLTSIFLLLASREPPWGDSHVVYDTTQALVDRGELSVNLDGPPQFFVHRGSKKYGVFPLGNVVALIPGYLAYRALRSFDVFPDQALFNTTCHLSPALMMAAACLLFFRLAKRRRASERTAFFVTVTLGIATLMLIYARCLFSEALQTVALLWVVERTLDQGDGPTLSGMGWLGFACGVLINSKLVHVLVLPPIAVYLVAMNRHQLGALVRSLPLGAIAFMQLFAILLVHNHLKTGSFWHSGYHDEEGAFSGAVMPALYGLYLSTGKGLFFYSPPLVLGLCGLRRSFQRHRAESWLELVLIALFTLVNAKFRFWHADYCWGPRHLLPVMPLLLLWSVPWIEEASRWLRRTLLVTTFSVGLAVQLLGATLYWDHYIRILIAVKDQTSAASWFQADLSHAHYIPSFSPLRGHVWLLSHLIRGDAALDRDAPWKKIQPQAANFDDAWMRLRLDWWPLQWLYQTPQATASAVTALCGLSLLVVISGGLCLARIRPGRYRSR